MDRGTFVRIAADIDESIYINLPELRRAPMAQMNIAGEAARLIKQRASKIIESYAVTSEAGTSPKGDSISPSGVRTDCLPGSDREDAAISQQSQPETVTPCIHKAICEFNGQVWCDRKHCRLYEAKTA